MAESHQPPFIRHSGLTAVEDLDAIILSYCSPATVGTLMRALPDHPLLAPNTRMWYSRIVMGMHDEWSLPPPYQIDWPGLLPTDYRSLWYALTSPAYHSYATMTEMMDDLDWPVRRYGSTEAPNKNALEAALDMTAIPTDSPQEPYQWSDAIIALLAEHVVQFVREDTNDTYTDTFNNMRHYNKDNKEEDDTRPPPPFINTRLLDWIIPAAASRGCTQLIVRLAERLGIPAMYGGGRQDWNAVMVGQWILTSANYMPETYILPSSVSDNPPLRIRLPTLTAATITTLWSAYVDEQTQHAIDDDTGITLMDLYDDTIENVVTLTCRDNVLFGATLEMLAILHVHVDMFIGDTVMFILLSPYRHVDDYTSFHMLSPWLASNRIGSDHATMDSTNDDIDHVLDYLQVHHIAQYYASRIKTDEQSRRFLEVGLFGRRNKPSQTCSAIFNGDTSTVYTYIGRARRRLGHEHVRLAIYDSCTYINGRLEHDRLHGTDVGEKEAVALLQNDAMRSLIAAIFDYRESTRDTTANRRQTLNLLITAAQSLPILEAAYKLFDYHGDDNSTIPLWRIVDTLVAIARDPHSDDGVLSWLMGRLSDVIPDVLDEWQSLQGWDDSPFPREEMWTNFVLSAIQIPNPYSNIKAPSPRLLQLIRFSVMPNYASRRHSRHYSLPMDLRREVDGGLPPDVIRAVARAIEYSDHNEDMLGPLLPYIWDPRVVRTRML